MADRRAQDRRVIIPGDPIEERVDGGFPGEGKASGGLFGQDGVTESRSRCYLHLGCCIQVCRIGHFSQQACDGLWPNKLSPERAANSRSLAHEAGDAAVS